MKTIWITLALATVCSSPIKPSDSIIAHKEIEKSLVLIPKALSISTNYTSPERGFRYVMEIVK